ncbi:pyridoxamine 5'-phosphate oxidase [Streptomyces albus]|uniref:pyridoxamine 5'-phosphate oxidase n=1 Tax=Streptomyces albus TaxID=1888 RepID=UPI0006916CE9|nr:pyridoxamine 5'-phosphate oxidase [Streptomyces albus]
MQSQHSAAPAAPRVGQAPETEPFDLFRQWLDEAADTEVNDPNAMALATADADGMPDVRIVLLKHHSPEGFVFFTNTQSAKGTELAANMQASGALHWKSVRRQIRFRGPVEFATEAEADTYFASRPRESRIGAWASRQSQPMAGRAELEEAFRRETARFGTGAVPRPPHWTGYRIRPVAIEFWSDRPSRLHERLVFNRTKPEGVWDRGHLFP